MALTISERLARLEALAEGKSSDASASAQFTVPRFDPTAQLTMPPNVMKAMANAFDPQVVANDHLGPGKSTSLPAVHGQTPKRATPNYAEPTPLKVWGSENLGKKREA